MGCEVLQNFTKSRLLLGLSGAAHDSRLAVWVETDQALPSLYELM
jgi:hypothetical protein